MSADRRLYVGPSLRRLRRDRGLTQADTARQSRVGRRFLIELENGKPGVRLDKVLAVLMGVGLVGVLVPVEAVQAAIGR